MVQDSEPKVVLREGWRGNMTSEKIVIKITRINGETLFKHCTEREAEEISKSYGCKISVIGVGSEQPRSKELEKIFEK